MSATEPLLHKITIPLPAVLSLTLALRRVLDIHVDSGGEPVLPTGEILLEKVAHDLWPT